MVFYLNQQTVAEVNLNYLQDNIKILKELIGPRLLLAVLKTNAYGHGLELAAQAAVTADADRIGVTTVEEGITLRNHGIQIPIHLLSPPPVEAAEAIVQFQLIAPVSTRILAQALHKSALKLNKKATVHLKINTGLQRFGLDPEEAVNFLQSVYWLHGLYWEGVYTHFSNADEGDWRQTEKEFHLYLNTVKELKAKGFQFLLHHAGASTIALERKDMYLDMVRPGIALFGCYPAARQRKIADLKTVMSVKTRLIEVRHVKPEKKIGYGNAYVTSTNEKIGVLPVGIGDGFRESLTNGEVLIRGQRAKVVGSISLDQTFVNVTSIPGAKVGDEVTIIGRQGNEQIRAETIAAKTNGKTEAVLACIMPRVSRVGIF